MFPPPRNAIPADSADFEGQPLIAPTGFREYDARWLFPDEINLTGMAALGFGLGNILHERIEGAPAIVVGHDYRAYSHGLKLALTSGLVAAGMQVHDIGLALSPTAYFAQFDLDVAGVAMVTASHNENGWTGVKMGARKGLTFDPDDMDALRDMVLGNKGVAREGGGYRFVPDFAARYKADLTNRAAFTRPLKAVVACGNGTAGAFAPDVLRKLGVEVVELHCDLDHRFPHYNPNPEDLAMLDAVRAAVAESKADLGFAFDGDGDRCGVVDDTGEAIFADKMGVLIARDLAARHPDARFVADVKSTGLFADDPELARHGAETHYWKTGHSYMKRHTQETGALAGFEKSGHFFFNAPIGRGYDDGLITAIAICDMLERRPDDALSDMRARLPLTFGSPTMSPHCPDTEKYGVVERVAAQIEGMESLIGQPIRDTLTVNGIRVTVEDGTWGLVRASSNKPGLVVVVESPVSEANMRAMFAALDALLAAEPSVGTYDQKI